MIGGRQERIDVESGMRGLCRSCDVCRSSFLGSVAVAEGDRGWDYSRRAETSGLGRLRPEGAGDKT